MNSFFIDANLKKELLGMLSTILDGYAIAERDFLIQFTYFELVDNKWLMKNFLDIGKETVQTIQLRINEVNRTSLKVYSRNPAYDNLWIKKKLDMRNKSTHGMIYACDLYDNFEPKYFKGKIWTKIPE